MTAPPPASSAGRLVAVQHLRAVAALMVVAFHVLGPAWTVGSAGVDVFFLISGFVMALAVRSPAVTPLGFAYDRAARILPLYWICTLALALAATVAPQAFQRLALTPDWLVLSLAMLPAFRPGTTDAFPVLYQGWTLNYEMFFYAVVTAALLLPRAHRLGLVTAVLLACVAYGPFRPSPNAFAEVYTDPLLLEFLAGFLFGHARAAGLRLPRGLGLTLVLAGLMGFALAVGAPDPLGWHRLIAWGLPAAALVIGAVALDDAGAVPAFPPLRFLGDASYSIYLTHGLTIPVLAALWRRLGLGALGPEAPALALVTFALATLVGVACHLAVEAPLQARLKRRRPARPVEAAG